MNNLIQLTNIFKSFNNQKKIKVLKKISYKFKKGKIYSLIGPSGSGKSTLLNLLSLIDKPSSGSISIENQAINLNDSDQNDEIRAKKIGIIYQQDNLLPDFTASENIYLASMAAGNSKELSLSKTKVLLKKVGLLNRSNHYPSQLSGGEKQRISIARALYCKDKPFVILDEPTGELDKKSGDKFFRYLPELLIGRTLILVTHNHKLPNWTQIHLEFK